MDKIRDEAMKRASQMQNPQSRNQPDRKDENTRAEQKPSQPEIIQKTEPQDPLSGLFKDKEKLLILLLIMVLSEESTNLELVLALLYIII